MSELRGKRAPAGWPRVAAAALLCAVVVAVGARRASAEQELEVNLKVLEPRSPAAGKAGEEEAPEEGAPKAQTPKLRATVLARPGLVEKDFVVKEPAAEPPVIVEAEKSVEYPDSDEPMALVILVQGNFRWMGNETYTDPSDPEAGAVYAGAFKGLGAAVDTLGKMGPPGSKAALLVYADGKTLVKQPLGDAKSLNGGALGSQQDYGEYISKPFIVGLTEAWKVLVGQTGHRKILVVIGDGNDDNEDISTDLAKIIGDLQKAEVETYSIHYAAVAEDSPQGQQNMKRLGYENHYNATSRDNFASYAGNIVEFVEAKYYVDFPGDALSWDGAEHEFVVVVSGEESEPKLLTLPVVEVPKPPEESSLWWLWLLLILLFVLIVVIIIVKRRQRPVPMPEPIAEAPPLEVAAVQKTVMLGVGGTENSMPIVGWVVPLNGPNQFQTFKLLQGKTKLGSGGEANVVVQDGFMSAEHAEIVCSQVGFMLKDLGSTNGTYLNDQKIASHELVDNDVFTIGKTQFKFKSIN